jgi:IclR family pca regulon transcriptional regulator
MAADDDRHDPGLPDGGTSPGQDDPAEREESLCTSGASGVNHRPNIRETPHPRHSRSLEYGLALLECFSAESHTLGIANLADMLAVSRSTTHRYALTLASLEYLEQDSKRKYRLAGGAADVGLTMLAMIAVRAGSWPVLEELRDQTGHTASFGVLNGARATYVQRAHGHGRGQYQADGDLGPGAHVPLHCTALGKAMLASQPEKRLRELTAEIILTREGPNTITAKHAFLQAIARTKGARVAVSDEEHTAGVRSIAVAVKGRATRETFGIEVTVPAARYTPAELRRHIGPSVRAAAQVISTQLGGGR